MVLRVIIQYNMNSQKIQDYFFKWAIMYGSLQLCSRVFFFQVKHTDTFLSVTHLPEETQGHITETLG